VSHRAPAPVATPAPAEVPVVAEAIPADEEPAAALLGEDDPLEALETADPRLVARMGAAAQTSTDDGAEAGPSPVEEVEQLDGDELRAVARALHGPSEI
jgi:hypothetical protein